MIFRRPAFVDERFLQHRLRSTSAGGLAGVTTAMLMFLFRLYHDHVVHYDLFAVGVVAVAVKFAVLFWNRSRD